MKHRPRQTGFTLLEMLVALAMMAVLAGALYASLSTGFRARAAAERILQPTRATTLVLEMVRHDLVSALPPTGILAGAFIGEDAVSDSTADDADTVTFFTAVPLSADATGQPGICKVQLLIREDDDGQPALYRLTTANLLAPTVPEPVEHLLCRNVHRLNLRYFDGLEWVDTWDSTTRDNALPVAVEVSLSLALSDRPDAPTHGLTRSFMLPCGGAPPDDGQVTVGAGGASP